MIILEEMTWSDAFSYGADNKINFVTSPLTQLVGKNGHGKSSIALILEEVLFNKNSKGIKKGDILNRYSKVNHYSINLDFKKDGIQYRIETKRGSTQQVKLFRAGVDISGHTATTTYKIIEELMGLDHKTFAQIVYQSHASSLEFLTSPDTARKKFLIELLNLTKYTKAGEIFKQACVELTKEMMLAQGKFDTITQWIAKYSTMDFTKRAMVVVPSLPMAEISESENLTGTILDIEKTNKKITQNNTYKKLLSEIQVLPQPETPVEDVTPHITKRATYEKTITDSEAFKAKISKLCGTCPTCLSEIDTNKTNSLIVEHDLIIAEHTTLKDLETARITSIKQNNLQWEKAQKSQQEWEKYHQLIDLDLPDTVLDKNELTTRLNTLQNFIKLEKQKIADAENLNKEAAQHNSKLDLIQAQLQEMSTELLEWETKLRALNVRVNNLNTLIKTFSTTGLVAYKIENLVKDLEALSNEYLGELSGGRFQISFQITGSDKLNVIITDNGTDIDIQALSGGERARVNVATLLAIRKLMQSLSQSRINLLILDETIEALDVDGKEKLIEVLLGEESLNTILVSHAFTHALLEKVHVVKVNNISQIEE